MAAHPEFTINNPAWGTVEWSGDEFGWTATIRANSGYYLKSWSFVEKLTGWGTAAGIDSENTFGWVNGRIDQTSGTAEYSGPISYGDGGWNSTVTAKWIEFAPIPGDVYTVTVSASPSEGGTVSGGGTYASGASCTVVATPAAGWRFARWTEGGAEVSTSATYSFAVSANRNLVAEFESRTKITATPDPSEGGTASGSGYFDPGQACTVVATPAAGWEFVRWSEDGEEVATTARYSFTVSASRDLVAEFTREFTITFNRLGVAGGMADYSEPTGGTESVKIKYGNPWPSIVMPTAAGYACAGYFSGAYDEFGQWDPWAIKWYNADGSPVNTTFTGVEDMTLDALWEPNRYDLTINPNGGIYAPGSRTHSSAVPVVLRDGLVFGLGNNTRIYGARRTGYNFAGYYTQPGGGELVYRPDPDNPYEEETAEGGTIYIPAAAAVEGRYWRTGKYGGGLVYIHPAPLTVYARWTRIPTHLILRNDAGVIMRSASSGAILRDD